MQVSRLTRYYLRKLHKRRPNYLSILNFILILLLISGNLPLWGLKLRGAIKSTAKHKHCTYDNSFVSGLKEGIVQGSSLEAVNIRATGGAIVGWYFINEGALYQGGEISFGKPEYKDNDFPLGVFLFRPANMTIRPDYENRRIYIMNSYFDKDGLHGLAEEEIERIIERVKDEE